MPRAALCLWWAKGGGDAEINTLSALIGILWRGLERHCDKAHVSQSGHETRHMHPAVCPHFPTPPTPKQPCVAACNNIYLC